MHKIRRAQYFFPHAKTLKIVRIAKKTSPPVNFFHFPFRVIARSIALYVERADYV
jgi:hypothetical protein